jgi:diguanylate cyclase (GGDEF)-like protein/PAS domain S-box-containing protein
MADSAELIEVALDSLPEGIALLGGQCQIVFWNQAAAAITGYARADLLSRQAPEPLQPLLTACSRQGDEVAGAVAQAGRGVMVHFQHKLGHDIPAIARSLTLRDGLGARLGMAVVFHPAESLDALPHGECDADSSVGAIQADLEDRLVAVYENFLQGGESFGVLWITVDQAHELRRTHGAGACEAMIEKVERSLASGLRPSEEMGRWGDDEFLILSHERTPEMLAVHAQTLAGLARTTDFRWWGDRVSLTVSIGAAQADQSGTVVDLLERAKAAMFTSFHGGGNQITSAPGGKQCSPS